MIKRQIDTDILNWMLLSEENLITFSLKPPIAEHIKKLDISLGDWNNDNQL